MTATLQLEPKAIDQAKSVKLPIGRFWRLAPAGMRRRWWLFRGFDWIIRNLWVNRMRQGLLVIRMDGLGDMVLFRNSLSKYSEAFGVRKEEIILLGCNSWGEVAQEVFAGYRVITIDEHAYAKRLVYRIRVNYRVRRWNVATTVCDSYFRRALMADSLAYVASAPRTIMALPHINAETRSEYAWYLGQVSDVIDTGFYPRHELDRHAVFTSYFLGTLPRSVLPNLTWQKSVPKAPIEIPYVVLNPGSNEPGRRWPLSNYIELAHWLVAKGFQVVFVGTAEEQVSLDLISQIFASDKIIDLMGATNLGELFDVMSHATLVVSNDTGPAHAAIGLGAPTVVIVGGGHFGCFVPYPKNVNISAVSFVYKRMECYHCFWRCHKREHSKMSFPCVSAVTLEQVQSASTELLQDNEIL